MLHEYQWCHVVFVLPVTLYRIHVMVPVNTLLYRFSHFWLWSSLLREQRYLSFSDKQSTTAFSCRRDWWGRWIRDISPGSADHWWYPRRPRQQTSSTEGCHRGSSIPQSIRLKAISLAASSSSSCGCRGRCGAWLSSATLALVIVVIVFIVSRAPDLVLLVKKLLGVGGWFSDVWFQSVEVGSLKKGGFWLPVLHLRHLRQCKSSTPTWWTWIWFFQFNSYLI